MCDHRIERKFRVNTVHTICTIIIEEQFDGRIFILLCGIVNDPTIFDIAIAPTAAAAAPHECFFFLMLKQ